MLPYVWMLCGAFAFACMGAFAHGLDAVCDWQVVVFVRAALATVFATALVLAAGARFVVFRPKTLWVRSIAGSISMLCTFYALPRLPIADVLTIANIFPVWVALLSWPLLGEKLSGGVWLAIVCAIAGVVLVQQPGGDEANAGALAVLFGSMATAVAMIGLHRLTDIDVRAVVVHFSAVATLFCIATFFLFPLRHTIRDYADAKVIAMLLGVGVSATIGQLLLTKAFTAGNAAKVSVVALSQVGFAMLFDVLFWARSFSAESLAGMALVVLPTAWLIIQEARRPATRGSGGGRASRRRASAHRSQAILHEAPFGEAVVQRVRDAGPQDL
ncbi:MAG TPA: DMT family transporter [Pirellulales bacterium]|nr:DMT family transporter [Pirellulales bacterium]